MFDDFRQVVKSMAKDKNLTYAVLAQQAGIEESTIKCFMCGANDSRRVAEKLADVLELSIIYRDGEFYAVASVDLPERTEAV